MAGHVLKTHAFVHKISIVHLVIKFNYMQPKNQILFNQSWFYSTPPGVAFYSSYCLSQHAQAPGIKSNTLYKRNRWLALFNHVISFGSGYMVHTVEHWHTRCRQHACWYNDKMYIISIKGRQLYSTRCIYINLQNLNWLHCKNIS